MKKGTVLNSDISSMISRLGHTDTLVVCDAGLPIPKSTTRIDMALTQGVPSFMQVLGVVTNEMQVEAAIIAEEIKQHNPQLHETLLTHLEQLQNLTCALKATSWWAIFPSVTSKWLKSPKC